MQIKAKHFFDYLDLFERVKDSIKLSVDYLRVALLKELPWRRQDHTDVNLLKLRLNKNFMIPFADKWPLVISRFDVAVEPRDLLEILVNSSFIQSFNK